MYMWYYRETACVDQKEGGTAFLFDQPKYVYIIMENEENAYKYNENIKVQNFLTAIANLLQTIMHIN